MYPNVTQHETRLRDLQAELDRAVAATPRRRSRPRKARGRLKQLQPLLGRGRY